MRFRSLSILILCVAVLVTVTGGCRGGMLARGVQVESKPSETAVAHSAPSTRLDAGGSQRVAKAPPQSGAESSPGGEVSPGAIAPGRTAGESTDADLDDLVSAFQNESPEVQSLVRRTAAVAQNLRRSPQAAAATATLSDQAGENAATEEGERSETPGAASTDAPEPKPAAAQQPAAESGEKTPSAQAAPSEDASAKSEPDDPDVAASGGENPSSQETPAEATAEELLQQLIAQLEKKELPTDEMAAARQVVLKRTLYALAGRVDEAAEPVEGWDASEQEFLRNQMLTLALIVDPEGPPSLARRWSLAWPHARESLLQLGAATAELVVERLAFVTEIADYGEVTAVKEKRFAPGEQVLLYCEIDNFGAERLSDGYETHFQGSWEIYDASGRRVFEQVLAPYRETCGRYRRDYYMGYQLYLPRNLAAGDYRLRLTVEDLKGKKYGQSEIEFAVTDAPAPAIQQAAAQGN